MKVNDLEIGLKSGQLCLMQGDFDMVLQEAIARMQEKGVSETTITLKLVVGLEKDERETLEGPVEYLRPTFRHSISSVTQIKNSITGEMDGDYEIVRDGDDGRFFLRPVEDPQLCMFDEENQSKTGGELPKSTNISSSDNKAVKKPISDSDNAFEYLLQYDGCKMNVYKYKGSDNLGVIADDGTVIVSSVVPEDSQFFCAKSKMESHVGHNVECAVYRDEEGPFNVSIECIDCNEVIFDIDCPDVPEESI